MPATVSIDQLPVDILVSILKSLDSFSTLHSALLSSRAFNNTWKHNEYGICQSITRRLIQPEAWNDALRLMRYHLASPGNNLIGRTQAAQLVLNKRKIDVCRDAVIYNALSSVPNSLMFGTPFLVDMVPGGSRFEVAFYRCWWYSVKFFDKENGDEAFSPGDSFEKKTACLRDLENESVLDMEQLFHIFTDPTLEMPIPWVVKGSVSQSRFSDVLWQLRVKVEGYWRKKCGI